MILFKKAADLRNYLDSQQENGNTIGFVPTMGALHDGHISLIRASKKETDVTVCSIFINPAQFNDSKDFEKYPVTLEEDIYHLESTGCDVLFLPSVNEIYPGGYTKYATGKYYELGYLETILEGKYRPGHFQGVCLVVDRLLQIVKPKRLYLGQKDYQQCMVIKRLIELTGLNYSIRLVICPTQREADGLAMSSRNMRLNKSERETAVAIYQALLILQNELHEGDLNTLKQKAVRSLEQKGFRVDYVEIADALTLQPADRWDGQQRLVALAAAFINEVRLIDNLPLN